MVQFVTVRSEDEQQRRKRSTDEVSGADTAVRGDHNHNLHMSILSLQKRLKRRNGAGRTT